MITLVYNALRVLVLLVAMFIGSVPLTLSLACGTAIRRPWLAYTMALAATATITFYSSWYPETFRFGVIDLKIHDGMFISGVPDLATALCKNLLLAYLGVLTGIAAREGYRESRSGTGKTGGPMEAIEGAGIPGSRFEG